MLPVFRKIVGQMQHDLFHVYTVDQHILQVIRNLRRLTMHEHAHELPSLTALMSDFGEPWRLYLAALFHDIAKGRGGDHSELGEHEVARFAKSYGLDQPTADLLQFLVAQHLTMSTIAQKHDLADPSVIESFAKLVQTPERLTALYLLTVSDIRGTSPKVWNNWKARLLESLYQQTMAYLKAETPQAARDAIGEKALMAKREEASRILLLYGRDLEQAQQFWADLDLGYFLRHDAADMAWHAACWRTDEPSTVLWFLLVSHPARTAFRSWSTSPMRQPSSPRSPPTSIRRTCPFSRPRFTPRKVVTSWTLSWSITATSPGTIGR